MVCAGGFRGDFHGGNRSGPVWSSRIVITTEQGAVLENAKLLNLHNLMP